MGLFSRPKGGKKQRRAPVNANAVMKDKKGQFPTRRRDGQHLPQHVQDQLDALTVHSASTREQLEALRSTRSKRSIGEVQVPAHLRVGETLDDRGEFDKMTGKIVRPTRRGDAAGYVLPSED